MHSLVIDPMTFEMVAVPLRDHSIAASLAHEPHALVNVSVGVDHTAFSMWLIVQPQPIISVPVLVEHRASSRLLIVQPIARVLSPHSIKLLTHILLLLILALINPVGALARSLVLFPAAFVLITVPVILHAKSTLLVVLPIANVSLICHPSLFLQ
jgi:hypothetical protein